MQNRKIALTGGIATGKTTVANRLRELGAIILDADEYARRVVEPETPSAAALREMIGEDYYNPDGTLKRRELREKIIEAPPLREKIDNLLHPFILQAMWAEWERQKRLHPDAIIIFDIPLLFEGHFDKDFDLIILVHSPPQIQIQRLMQRDEVNRREAERTLSMQAPIDSKKARSHYIIDNSSTPDLTIKQVDEVWEKIWEVTASPLLVQWLS
ncbi:MAG: dephospho-CoA kinase [Syntrophobacteraceae bacterium]